ncbi:MAG: hypothetical protein LAO18_01945 [Acidobacteriia bacterium]|nr:hypothetical protein [Terriglobia bacterium]
MNTATSTQPADTSSIPSAILSSESGFHRATTAVENLPAALGPRRVGYGLPCVKCKTYYAADLTMCPVCKTEERVSPIVAASGSSSPSLPESALPVPDEAALEEERERFLREFKSKVYAAHVQIDPAEIAPVGSMGCSVEENHEGGFEPAAVCQHCYVRLQERVDLMEAALHMDLVEATRVVYEAVWADPSDPGKTYQNAARAILAELRKRAGISVVLGSLQPLTH